ncbi:MAG: hypothetical protein QOG49_1318, partial [Frankiaceae bacterium]|nr:hypothetical protein [Frankiaceae bacterium]
QAMKDSGKYPQLPRDEQDDVPYVPETVVADGAAVVVLAVGGRARELTSTPVWIRGIDHRIEPPALGVRDLTSSPSTETAARVAGAVDVDAAFLHVPYPHQELVLRAALGLEGQAVHSASGPTMVGGLERFAAAAAAITAGDVRRAVAHATSGPCLQQNLVALLEGNAA